METLTIEALSVAAFATALQSLPHETRATVTATESGIPWAVVSVSPLTDTARSIFPLDAQGVTGDSRKVGHRGAMFRVGSPDAAHAVGVVIDRARRMF